MRTIRALLAVLALALSFVVLVPATSYACSCAISGARAYVDHADVVVVGTVTDRRDPPQRDVRSSTDPVTYTVAVDRVLAGEAHATTEIRSAASGASCGLEEVRPGRRYVLFANVDPEQRLRANLCGGTAPATAAYLREVSALTGPGQPPTRDGAELPRFTTVGMPDDTPGAGGPSAWTLVLGGAGAAALLLVGGAVALVLRANRPGT